jgi:hypothetical protein
MTPTTFKDLAAVTATTIATVWDPATGKRFCLMGGTISVSAAGSVLFEDGSAGAGNFVFRTPKLEADKPYTFSLGDLGRRSAQADNNLKATLSVAGTITGTLYGVEK